jgi:hypothetical protein
LPTFIPDPMNTAALPCGPISSGEIAEIMGKSCVCDHKYNNYRPITAPVSPAHKSRRPALLPIQANL